MANETTATQNSDGVRRGVLRWAGQILVSAVLYAALLVSAAGRWDWVQGWVFLGLNVFTQILSAAVLIPRQAGMLAERSQTGKNTKGWDRFLAPLILVFTLASILLAGLDNRLGWSGAFSPILWGIGLLLALFSQLFVLWAMASNPFFSTTVRIQEERGHTVVAEGPYRLVRHPGYAGSLLFNLATPLALGSWWTFLPVLGVIATLFVRTALEDRTLQAELKDYAAYARLVTKRLIPGIW
jgi:protein-S-isoprenylcysteine O-methyltransferase Ste14